MEKVISWILVLSGISLGVVLVKSGASPGISIFPIIATSIGFIYWKRLSEVKRNQKIVSGIPRIARMIERGIRIGKPFLAIIASIQTLPGLEEISREFNKVINEVNLGTPVPVALRNSASRIEIEDYSRLMNRLILVYKNGGGGSLEKLADDIEEKIQIRMKSYSNKSMLYSLILIAASAILPSMFLTYLIVGSMFLHVEFSPVDAFLIPAMIIPSIDIMVLGFIWTKRPGILSTTSRNTWLRSWDASIEYLGLENKKLEIIVGTVLLSTILFYMNPLTAIIPPIAAYGIPIYLADARRARIKRRIPDIAMEFSSLWDIIPIQEMLARSGDKSLSDAGKMIERGTPVPVALEIARKREPELGQIISILITGWRSGVDVSSMLSKLADQYSKQSSIVENMKASMMIEKATIISASALIVPFVIGSTESLASGIGNALIGNPLPVSVREMAVLGSKVYTGVYSLLSGLYLSMSSGKSWRSGFFYSAIILVIAILVLLASEQFIMPFLF